MTFGALAVIAAVGVLGPLLALPERWHLPVVLGELVAGIALGPTGVGALHAPDPTFTFLANIGFALVMFVAGSHVPVRDPRLRTRAADRRAARGRRRAASPCPSAIAISPWLRHRPRRAVRRAARVVVGGAGPADRRLAAALAGPRRRCSCCPGRDRRRGVHRRAAAGDRSGTRRPGGARCARRCIACGAVLFVVLRDLRTPRLRNECTGCRRSASSRWSCGSAW